MDRVLVIGCSGSGKSVFARRLAAITCLPLYYLDMIWHRADRTTISRAEFDQELAEILARNRWIIEGNFQRTLAKRLERCDTVFLFDLPVEDCLAGVEARIGHKRSDMPWIETWFDPDFRQWIMNFRKDRLPGIMARLEKKECVKVIFKNRGEADEYLDNLRKAIEKDR